jgi:hypothetical protein
MAEPSDEELERLAERITLSPQEFGEIFDPLSKEDGGSIWMVVRLMSAPGKPPYLIALQKARDGGWLPKLADEIATRRGIPAMDEDSEDGRRVRAQMHAIVQPSLGLLGADDLRSGAILAVRRVCKIEVVDKDGKLSSGTGFLVGPQAVLTNWHVIEPALDAEGKAEKAAKVVVVFDHLQVRGSNDNEVAADWLIGSSKYHPIEKPTKELLAVNAPADGFDTYLDYAVIRLARPLGRERGYYALDPAHKPSVAAKGSQVLLFQHPGGLKMFTAWGAGTSLLPTGIETRLRHTANATVGSSGGLLLDKDFKPVALHQCGFTDPAGNGVINGAIPTSCIASGLPPDTTEVIGVDPIFRTTDGAPIVGRDTIQDSIDAAAKGIRRIIAVRGAPKSGKSFSVTILRSMLGEAEHLYVMLPASEVPTKARDLGVELLRRVTPAGSEPPALPDGSDAETAMEAWIRDTLAPALIAALRAAAGTRTIWVIIDDLNSEGIPDTSARRLLEHLYQNLAAADFLRFVLIGLAGAVPGAPEKLVVPEDTRPLVEGDVKIYLERVYTAANVPLDQATISLVGKGAMKAARQSPLPQVVRIADFLSVFEPDEEGG